MTPVATLLPSLGGFDPSSGGACGHGAGCGCGEDVNRKFAHGSVRWGAPGPEIGADDDDGCGADAPPLTYADVLRLRGRETLYHRTATQGGGAQALRVRQTGRVKTWKTRPGEFRLPVKWGLRDSGAITHLNVSEWSLVDRFRGGVGEDDDEIGGLTNEGVVKRWLARQHGQSGSMSTDGTILRSYALPIGGYDGEGKPYVVNYWGKTSPSLTTSSHVRTAAWAARRAGGYLVAPSAPGFRGDGGEEIGGSRNIAALSSWREVGTMHDRPVYALDTSHRRGAYGFLITPRYDTDYELTVSRFIDKRRGWSGGTVLGPLFPDAASAAAKANAILRGGRVFGGLDPETDDQTDVREALGALGEAAESGCGVEVDPSSPSVGAFGALVEMGYAEVVGGRSGEPDLPLVHPRSLKGSPWRKAQFTLWGTRQGKDGTFREVPLGTWSGAVLARSGAHYETIRHLWTNAQVRGSVAVTGPANITRVALSALPPGFGSDEADSLGACPCTVALTRKGADALGAVKKHRSTKKGKAKKGCKAKFVAKVNGKIVGRFMSKAEAQKAVKTVRALLAAKKCPAAGEAPPAEAEEEVVEFTEEEADAADESEEGSEGDEVGWRLA